MGNVTYKINHLSKEIEISTEKPNRAIDTLAQES